MKLFALLVLFCVSAHAHIQIGTYKGETPERSECSVEFKSISFVTSFRHPLAERVTVEALGKTFVLQHPVKVDAISVLYNDESLEAVVPVQGGAEFFQVVMSHEEGNEGPQSFSYKVHDWRTNAMTTSSCDKLVFQN